MWDNWTHCEKQIIEPIVKNKSDIKFKLKRVEFLLEQQN